MSESKMPSWDEVMAKAESDTLPECAYSAATFLLQEARYCQHAKYDEDGKLVVSIDLPDDVTYQEGSANGSSFTHCVEVLEHQGRTGVDIYVDHIVRHPNNPRFEQRNRFALIYQRAARSLLPNIYPLMTRKHTAFQLNPRTLPATSDVVAEITKPTQGQEIITLQEQHLAVVGDDDFRRVVQLSRLAIDTLRSGFD